MTQTSLKRATREEILKLSVPLFAERGYEAVSMREIAAAVGVQAPALYYHFPDKQSLYMAVMEHAFTGQLKRPLQALNSADPPLTRLKNCLAMMVEDLTKEPYLLLLLQRERLDGDETRQKLLVDQIFTPPLLALTGLMAELAPDQDAALLSMSITGMVMHLLELRRTAHLLPGWKPEHDDPDYLIRHIHGLVQAMFASNHD